MKTKKIFKIEIDVWGAVVHVCAGTSRKKAIQVYNSKIDRNVNFLRPDPSENISGSTLLEDSNKGLVIWFRSAKPGSRVITHESIHAAFHILETSGVKIHKETQEALCYLSDFLVGSIIKKLSN